MVRPTADRVREALFGILSRKTPGARVLDAYSGCGALGFEALSRGALAVTFIESDPVLSRMLRQSAERFGVLGRCAFLEGRTIEILAGGAAPGPFELILADPPYASSEATSFLPMALERLGPEGWIVLERDSRRPPVVGAGLGSFRTERYGRASLDFFQGQVPG